MLPALALRSEDSASRLNEPKTRRLGLWLERKLHTRAEAGRPARDGAERDVEAAIPDVVEAPGQVVVEVPVDAEGEAVHATALDLVGLGRAVVEVDVRVAGGKFPGA